MDMPSHLGKYVVTAQIGRGAMGVVYKGFDPHIQRTVALKTIRKDTGGHDQMLAERFKHEAQAAGRLSHPGIVAVFDYGEVGDLTFIAMEYVEGHDLGESFTRGTQFALKDTVSLMVQLLDALGHAHSKGVVHRDIKPSNIILTSDGRVKVADFGIARIEMSELTQSGVVMGTPSYMAPEQYLGHPVDRRTDLFAAGVILFQLLTGQRPFHGSYEQMVYKVCHEDPPKPSEVVPGLVAYEFDRIVETALARSPGQRYQDASVFRQALEAAFAAPVEPTLSADTRLPPSYSAPATERPLATPTPGSSGASQSPVPHGWDAGTLKEIEQQLAVFVGPLARVMVRKAAKTTRNLDMLYGMLVDELERPDERRTFIEGRTRLSLGASQVLAASPSQSAVSQVSAPGREIPADVVELAAKRLTPLLGPIAKLVARRTARGTTNEREYYRLLADNLTDPRDRAEFLRTSGYPV
jgi:serine/threonine-protein kinase